MKRVFFILFLTAILVLCCACTPATDNTTDATEQQGESMTLAFLLNPPKCKTFTDPQIIKQVTDRIELIEKTPLDPDFYGAGWAVKVVFPDGTALSFSYGADYIYLADVFYKVSEIDSQMLYTDLKAIYDNLQVEETPYER